MTHRSSLYGLVVECDVALPGVAVDAVRGGVADVRVHVGTRPSDATGWMPPPVRAFYRSDPAEGDPPALVADRPGAGAIARLSYAEGVRFHVRDDGREVWADWDPPMVVEDAITYLLGPVLGYVLRLRGELAVHASAVVFGGAAWGFVGAGGAGKSTLAAALAQAGHAILTEDVLALRRARDGWIAWPAYDHLRLWEDSPALRGREGAELPPLSPTYEKRALDLARAGLPRAAAPAPLAGWFALGESADGATSRVRPIPGGEALRTLVHHSYMGYLLDEAARGSELRAVAEVVRSAAGYHLEVGEGRTGLDDTVRLIRRVTGERSP